MLVLWDLPGQEKSVAKTIVFDTLSMNRYYLPVLLAGLQMSLLHSIAVYRQQNKRQQQK